MTSVAFTSDPNKPRPDVIDPNDRMIHPNDRVIYPNDPEMKVANVQKTPPEREPSDPSLSDRDPTLVFQRSKLQPGLYVVATPIGNLRDITLRALDVLASADLVLCEDTRVARILLKRYGIAPPLAVYNDHSGPSQIERISRRIEQGGAVALISDAGTPMISDPGYRLVSVLRNRGQAVFAVPGPSAAIAALSVAGLPSDRFLFVGFLPPKSAARRRALASLGQTPETIVFYETVRRLPAMWADLVAAMPHRRAVILRELTKLYEEVRMGTVADLESEIETEMMLKGELVVVVGPPGDTPDQPPRIDTELAEVIKTSPTRTAALLIKEKFKVSRAQAYRMVLEIKGDGAPDA